MMNNSLQSASSKTLTEALEPENELRFRDRTLAAEPMPNFKAKPSTNENPHGLPLKFWASWELSDRPRRIALLMDDCQEEYRPYAREILPQLRTLTTSFRSKRDSIPGESGGVCLVWSVWSRTYDDGISNSMDRWYGPRGLRPENPENAVYVFGGQEGLKPLTEIAPTPEEIREGWLYHGRHLDMFWNVDDHGKSYLDEKLKSQGIDTVVIAGLWTDECILSTAFAANSRGYDVIVVKDAVGTATANQEAALTVANGTCAKVLTTQEIVSYLEKGFVLGEAGAVKGTSFPDGRKE